MRKSELAMIQLREAGIRCMADVDAKRDPCKDSRYSFLVRIVGHDVADAMMNELAIKQCCHAIGGGT